MYPEAALGFSRPLEAYDYLPSSVVVVVVVRRRSPSVVVRCWLVGVKFYPKRARSAWFVRIARCLAPKLV
jgi:hypothetical protein